MLSPRFPRRSALAAFAVGVTLTGSLLAWAMPVHAETEAEREREREEGRERPMPLPAAGTVLPTHK
ncbi:MAG: hypothetical protein K8R56_04950, partial [Candidatus Eisenbacteria bacterium]|nr:hypothetical protein [Candidatus Eisenbacteria bacterium]